MEHIRYVYLVMSRRYIEKHFADIVAYADVIERRLDDSDLSMETLIAENAEHHTQCLAHNCRFVLIDEDYGHWENAF